MAGWLLLAAAAELRSVRPYVVSPFTILTFCWNSQEQEYEYSYIMC